MLEREHKYDVGPGFVLPSFSGVEGVAAVSAPVEHRMEATYFDTADHRLVAAGMSLRRRTGGSDDGWHLKLPSAIEPEARHELRLAPGRAVRTVPRRFRQTVAGVGGAQPLQPVATIRTHRTVRHLVGDDGNVLAEVADDVVEATLTAAGGKTTDGSAHSDQATRQWREVEVELVDGDHRLLQEVGKRLEEAGAQRSARLSKVADVIGGPTDQPPARVRGKDAVRELLQPRIAALVEQVRRRDPLAREDLPEGVHTMRVAIRRLRSTLATARPFVDRSVTDPLRDELAWLSDALGDARDAEVQRERLDEAVDELVEARPDVAWDDERVRPALASSLHERHQSARATLDQVLDSERYAALLDRLRELAAAPPWSDQATKKVRGAYRRRVLRELRRLGERMAAASDPDLAPDERAARLHEARKAAKRARYAVEPVRPVYGKDAKRLAKRLKALQSALGQHQDTVVTRTHLLELSPRLDAPAALAAGALVERESRAAERYEREARAAYARVRRSRLP